MYFKCELLIGGYAYGVTDLVQNWEDIVVSFKRNDYDGVVRTFADKFEFVKGARTLILNEYKKNYLRASANVVIYTRNNSWTWTERFRCALNFSTLSDNGFVVSINAIDDSVASLIKAKKGTQYEYSVDVVKDELSLEYDRMDMDSLIKWTDGASIDEDLNIKMVNFPSSSARSAMALPLYITSSEIAVKGKVECNDVSDFEYLEESDMTPFVRAVDDITIHLDMEMYLTNLGALIEDVPVVYMRKYAANGLISMLAYKNLASLETVPFTFNDDVSLKAGDSLKIFVVNNSGKEFNLAMDMVNISVSFRTKDKTVYMSVIKPVTLLNRLLKSMNGGVDGLTGVIVPLGEKRLDNAMILAAESARQMPGAKIYSSFTKFCDWMKAVFGYVYDINGKTVTFRPRKDYFGDSVVKEIQNYTGFAMNVNSSLIYSQVNVGYDKQDYDSVNGKDEFRFTNQYTTGITITENKLDLISPYRADAYGIEFLAQRIGEDTTDNSSDTDVFFVCVQSDGTKYTLDRSDSITGVISPETMFNVMYSPSSMITANEAFLGGFISELSYASSEGNTAVRINGEAENRDISITGGKFLANEIEVETSDIDMPSDMTGVIQFERGGEVYQGYYKSADFSYTRTKSSKITLIMKK